MNRKTIIAGNWKMHTTLVEGIQLAKSIVGIELNEDRIVILGVPATHLRDINELVQDKPNFFCAAQNCHQNDSGAYTGEISAVTLSDMGVTHVILGHSERRAYFGETDKLLKDKVLQAIRNNLKVIFCVGEALEVREANQHIDLVQEQISTALFELTEKEIDNVIIAYEPVWAIGTGKTATPEQAQDMHFAIREMIAEKYGNTVSNRLHILYGGSVKPNNAKEIFGQKDVDGALVGGASLEASSFVSIINA